MSPQVLVTGANGYTGARLCQYLAGLGIATRGMYWLPDGAPDFSHENLDLVAGDLCDRPSLERAVEGVEVVYNIAALYRPAHVSRREFWAANVEGVRNIMEVSASAGVQRFVQCSTIGVHGHVQQPPADEGAPIKPDDYYQFTKLKGEELARQLGKELSLPTVVVRPAAIYGPLERRFLKLPRLIQKRRFLMFGKGDVLYHFIHISDLCEAFVLCARAEKAVGQTYIIADGGAITLNDIVRIISEALRVPVPRRRLPLALLTSASVACELACKPFRIPPPLHRRRASWFHHTRSFDISKARAELNYSPRVSPEVGLKEMVSSYRECGWIE